MSLTAAAIRLMGGLGLSVDQIADVAEANAPLRDSAAERRRAYDRERKRNSTGIPPEDNSSNSANSTGIPPEIEPSRMGAPVVLPSLSSLPTEVQKELKPISPNGEITPLKLKSNDFTRFWQAYPSKVGKPVAEKAYAKAIRRIPGPDPPGTLLAGVERAKASRKWLDGIIPNPATWLNQDRWLDEPAEIIPITGAFHDRFDPDAKRARREANSARSDEGAYLAARQRFQP